MPKPKLEYNQRISAFDLAEALNGEEGAFLCQQGGQSYIAISAQGHSIASLKPVGRHFNEVPGQSMGAPEAWLIEKISVEQSTQTDQTTQGNRRS